MNSTVKNKSFTQPKTVAELLPGLCGILSKDAIQTIASAKKSRPTMAQPRTAENTMKPMTMAEIQNILALKAQTPRKLAQQTASTSKKRNWNSSVKVDCKTKNHTADIQTKHNSVRKVLNFHPKTKPITNVRATIISSETPKFPKPEFRAKKPLHLLAKNTVRISGVCNIPETPVITNKQVKNRMTIQQQGNKENRLYQATINRKLNATPKLINRKRDIPQTPLSNISFKSNSDSSFLQKEKEINDIEEKTTVLSEEPTLEKISEVSPPVSTPFKEYRNVQEFFNHTSETDASALYHDNTIMCFDKLSISKENNKREESVIVSLCDMLNKATVNNSKPTELNDLLQVEKQTEDNIKMIENGITTLNNIKESQLKSLQYVRKLINEKRAQNEAKINIKTPVPDKSEIPFIKTEKESPLKSPILSRPSVIKSKSPTYKIPRKSSCLRKKVFCKSMPNVSDGLTTPEKGSDKALNMYLQMKEKMNFLNTPLVKQRNMETPDTPSLTSHNLQMQLDKLYNES